MEFLLIAFAIVLVSLELATFLTYGWFVGKHHQSKYINLKKEDIRLNMFDSSIIMIGDKCLTIGNSISSVTFCLSSKYYIKEIGLVPRWSKLHKKINEYYKALQ